MALFRQRMRTRQHYLSPEVLYTWVLQGLLTRPAGPEGRVAPCELEVRSTTFVGLSKGQLAGGVAAVRLDYASSGLGMTVGHLIRSRFLSLRSFIAIELGQTLDDTWALQQPFAFRKRSSQHCDHCHDITSQRNAVRGCSAQICFKCKALDIKCKALYTTSTGCPHLMYALQSSTVTVNNVVQRLFTDET